jgi:DNA mismatch repair protein MutL
MLDSPQIKILDSQVVNQIAAGEVVERPASVVKELVENSIDAKATEITVIIANGGKALIEILDNGCGMSKQNLLIAIERHGTSKISSVDNLLEINSLGFRGEALPSIASVSKFSIISRCENQKATEIILEAGRVQEVNELNQPLGTRIKVKELFYNVPARKKFLKSDSQEVSYIKAYLSDLYLATPGVRFSLVVDGKNDLLLAAENDFFKRAENLGFSGKDFLVLDKKYGPLQIQAVLSVPLKCVANSARLRTLVNGRTVRDRLILSAVRSGYGAFIKAGKYPIGVFSINLPGKDVDVNVHPQKSEVRFRDSRSVFALINSQVSGLFKDVDHRTISIIEQQRVVNSDFSFVQKSESEETSFFESDNIEHSSFRDLRYLGQILDVYLLFAGQNSLSILDMHAAHERVQYYRLRTQYESKNVASQALLLPVTIELPSGLVIDFEQSLDYLARLGFELELFGESSCIVRAVPALLVDSNFEQLITEILTAPEWSLLKKGKTDAIDPIVTRMACHRAIRKGYQMSTAQAYALLASLKQAENSAFCPHGRPVMIELDAANLEKLFGRSGF